MIASLRIAWTSSGVISGSGLAMAKMTGLGAMLAIISGVKAPLADEAQQDVGADDGLGQGAQRVSTAWALFHWFMPSVRPR
jgi:hypothetical protein